MATKMESLLSTTPQEKEAILKIHNISEDEVKRDVEIIKIWRGKQPHLPRNDPDSFIGNVLLKNKFRIEKTKQKLDNYYSLRGQHQRDLVSGFEDLVPSQHVTIHLPMPKLTPSLERIVVIKLLKNDPEEFDVVDMAKMHLCMEEFCLRYNYSESVRYVCDYAGVSFKHLPRLNPIVIGKLTTLTEKAYSKRVVGVEFINFPAFANRIMTMLKMVSPPKIHERIRIHENMESLYELVPKEYLPVEYGGSSSDIPDLLKKWDEVMEHQRDFLVENCDNVSAEHLRPAESKRNESFGAEGTFKKLQLD